jgi:hypothetical protein
VVLLVVVLLIGAAAYEYSRESGSVNITVDSTHLTQTVSVTVSVDGTQLGTQSLAPGNSLQFSHSVFVGTGCETVTVLASSTGGGLGPESDSQTPTLCPGASVAVTLYV